MASDRAPHKFPRFDNVEDERRHRKQRLAAALRLFGHLGYDEGAAGHITARDPELLDHFWVNPLAMSFKQIRVKDLLLVNDRGEVVEGTWPVNTAAFVIHSHIHAARPDVIAAAHSHSMYGKAWSTLRRPLDPLTQDACAFYGDHAVYDDYTGVVLDGEEGKRIAAALGDCKAAILANHGLLTVGRSVDEAAWWFVSMDRSCQAQLLAEAVGKPVPIDPEQAAKTAMQMGGARSGWMSFQPLYDWIVSAQPDLLDE
jgi:ribulose-5-phosphate 4-epimerase/fuculose-1-phosphate aldolase